MKRERNDETKGLRTPQPSQYVCGHHRDSGASRDSGESLLRAGFSVGERISKCETGDRRVDLMELIQLAKLYKRPIQFFFGS